MRTIPTIVLTGGPCSGKTTALAHVREWLIETGYQPLIAPEAATILIGAVGRPGASFSNVAFQSAIARQQLFTEKTLLTLARDMHPRARPVLILDRGLLDGCAYMQAEEFAATIGRMGMREAEALARYTAVIHLRSAALGAEDFYTLGTNTARCETIEEARALDERTLTAWTAHPHLRVVENRPGEDFAGKVARVRRVVAHTLGVPEPLEIERKFLVDRERLPSSLPVPHRRLHILQHYLRTKGGLEVRVRATEIGGAYVYTRTEKRDVRPGVRVERESLLTHREYASLLQEAGGDIRCIEKTRITFIWQHQYFELDLFHKPRNGMAVLEVELTDLQDTVSLPPFVPVTREVTDDPAYSNARLAVHY